MEIETISSFADAGNIFESTGYSIIRITQDGKPRNIKIPIRTKGVDEVRRKLSREAPEPPVITRTIQAESDEGKALGLEEDQDRKLFDLTDKAYVEATIKHGERVLWESVIQGLNVTWPAGCDSFDDKKNLLISKGITNNQLTDLFKDILKLTVHQEGREDFLPENLSDLPPVSSIGSENAEKS